VSISFKTGGGDSNGHKEFKKRKRNNKLSLLYLIETRVKQFNANRVKEAICLVVAVLTIMPGMN
jgi:hypothetical protein